MADMDNMNDEQNDQESDQFNSMLSAAKKQVGSSGGSSLTQAQIEAMLAGDDEEDNSDDEQGEPGTADVSDTNADAQSGGDAEDTGDSDEDDENPGDGENAGKKAKKSKKEKKPKEKKEKKPVNKALIARIMTVVGVLTAGAVGFAAALLMYGDLMKSSGEALAIKAANALNSRLPLNTQLSVYKAYVYSGAASDVCMLYAVTSLGGNDKLDMYRIVIDHDDPNTINMYYTLDENSSEYLRLLNSENGEERVQASVLKTYSDLIYETDTEIRSGSREWERIDCSKINRNITSSQKK